MFCRSCGEQIADMAAVCPKCGTPVAGRASQIGGALHIPNHLVGSILVTVFCCWPFGIPAIVYAARVNGLIASGDINGARQASKTAAMWMWISFGLFAGLVIIGILATIAIQNISGNVDDANKAAAQASVRYIDDAVTTYKIEHYGRLPNSIKDLIDDSGDKEPILKGGEGTIQDPWGTEYKLGRKGTKYYVVSAGPDMQFGTEDDIRSDKIEKKND